MTYTTVAGLQVEVGPYTAFVPMIIYALLGTSRILSVSSTATLAILAGTQLGLVVPDAVPGKLLTAAATLTVLVGILLALASLFRLGFVANFISTPVLTGFKAGIGLVIILDQAPKLLGLHIAKESFFEDLLSLAMHLPETSITTLLIAVSSLLALVALKKISPKLPGALIVLGGTIVAVWFFSLNGKGVSIVGNIPQGLPTLSLPDVHLVIQLLPGALGIALMSFTETIAAGRAFTESSEPQINANKELLATGASNIGGAFLGSMPAGGGTSQTAVVRAVGGKTQASSIVTAGTSVATMLLLAPIIGMLPHAALAAVVIFYSIGLIQFNEFLNILKIRRMEFYWAVIACMGVLVFGTLQGIVVAIIVSLIGLFSQIANPRVHVLARKNGTNVLRPLSGEYPDDETFPGLLIVRPEGRIFFVNAQNIKDRIWSLLDEYEPKALVIDMSNVPDIEYTALCMLIEGEERNTRNGITFYISALNPSMLEMVKNSELFEKMGRERLVFNACDVIKLHQEKMADK
ncbi:MAG: SulP family inorganic anion transporter [Gammaproteobacteria bacterium]|nr:SulP family inorganic anion transporter [Gammaproteobacteria bacterium]